MSDTNEITQGCLIHYDNQHLQVRKDFLSICAYNRADFEEMPKQEPDQECMAKILRLLETLTDHQKTQWKLNAIKATEKGLKVPDEPKEYPIELTYGAIGLLLSMQEPDYAAYGESTIRNSVAYLLSLKYIRRIQERKNSIPIYWLQIDYVQECLKQKAEARLSGVEINSQNAGRKQVLKSTAKRPKSTASAVKSTPESPKSAPPAVDFNTNNIGNTDDITEKDKTGDTASDDATPTPSITLVSVKTGIKRSTDPKVKSVEVAIGDATTHPDTPAQTVSGVAQGYTNPHEITPEMEAPAFDEDGMTDTQHRMPAVHVVAAIVQGENNGHLTANPTHRSGHLVTDDDSGTDFTDIQGCEPQPQAIGDAHADTSPTSPVAGFDSVADGSVPVVAQGGNDAAVHVADDSGADTGAALPRHGRGVVPVDGAANSADRGDNVAVGQMAPTRRQLAQGDDNAILHGDNHAVTPGSDARTAQDAFGVVGATRGGDASAANGHNAAGQRGDGTTSMVAGLGGDAHGQLEQQTSLDPLLPDTGTAQADGSPAISSAGQRAVPGENVPLSLQPDRPNVALSAKEQERLLEKRKTEIRAIIKRETKMRLTKTWWELTQNDAGLTRMIADEFSDEDISAAAKAMMESTDSWMRDNFSGSLFYARMPGLLNKSKTPQNGHAGTNGKAPPPTVVTGYQNKSEELRRDREKYAQGGRR